METKTKSIVTVFGTELEHNAMRKILAEKASKTIDGKLSMSDMILRDYGIRKPKS